jgi:hypothetical protein
MLPLRLRPLRIIPRQSRNCTSNRAPHTIANPLSKIANLARSLLSLALLVLTNAFLLESLGAHEPADGFLCGADVLVPGAGGAVVVVFCDAARRGDGEGAGFGGGM